MPDIEEKAQSGAGHYAPSTNNEKSSGTTSPDNEKEPTEEEIQAVRLRAIAKREAEQAEEEQLQKKRGPTVPLSGLFKSKDDKSLDEIATQPSVFDDKELAKYFQPHPKWENRHRFDPSARWTWREEMKVVNKIDWRITLWACIAFFGLDLGRGNLQQANTDSFLPDLGMDTDDYNLGVTVFQISFLCAELPSQMISKKIGPDRWIPFIMCSWSIVSLAQFWLSGRSSFLATRALLGMLQGGFIPDVVLYLTYFFKASELPFRLAMFWTVRRITDIVAPLLAYGVLRMRGLHGLEGWRWLFLVEGCIMLSIGIWSWFAMAASPTQTKTWYCKEGWFTERDEYILVNRVIRDDPSKSDMHNRQAINFKMLWKALCDFDLWPIYCFALVWEIPPGPPEMYLTLSLRELGFDTFDSNLLSIPCQVGGALTLLTMTYFSEIFNERAFFGILTQVWCLPNIIALAVLPGPGQKSPWVDFAVITVLLSYPSPHAMHVSWASRNSNSVRTRAVSTALYNMLVQLSRVIYANIYRADDAPDYRRGNRTLIGICVMNIFVYLIAKGYYIYRNKSRSKIWDNMTTEERSNYLATTTDTGSKRLDVRFWH